MSEEKVTAPSPDEAAVHEAQPSGSSIAPAEGYVKKWTKEGRRYFHLAVDALDALLDPRLSDQQRTILLHVIRESWAKTPTPTNRKLGRREDWTPPRPMREWALVIGIHRDQLYRQVAALERQGVLKIRRDGHGLAFSFSEYL